MYNLSEYFTAVAAKYLSAVDAEPNKSNQHEFGGLVKAGFGKFLLSPDHKSVKYDAKFIYFDDATDEPLTCEGEVTWYDSRAGQSHRGPELRLYYQSNEVTERMTRGDLMIVTLRPDDSLMLFFTPADSQYARSLCYLFNTEPEGSDFRGISVEGDVFELDFVRSAILQYLDVAPAEEPGYPDFEDLVSAEFGDVFPNTFDFSKFARDTLTDIDPVSSPDESLLKWMQREEALFFALERIIVGERIADGFPDVEDFIRFSLSVQNRRKSRVGHALEHHLAEIFMRNNIFFDRGVITEHKSRPDFLFPGLMEYQNAKTDIRKLFVLGAKTSCKDRWRQVLSEARRIEKKHLLTLEPAISEAQTDEMKSHKLQLVVPAPLQKTYQNDQAKWLMSLGDFIIMVRKGQESGLLNRLI